MATFSVFGDSVPIYPTAVYDNGIGITLANVFYLTPNNGDVAGWRSVGGRVYIPNDPAVTNKSITIMAWVGNAMNPLNTAFHASKEVTTTTPASGGWCEVLWDEPFDMDYGPQFAWAAIGYKFNGASEKSNYIACSPEGAGPPPNDFASSIVGESLVLAHSNEPGYIAWRDRGGYLIEGDTSQTSSNLWYGVDILVDDGPTSPYAPTAAYGFNEASGEIAVDASGNNRDLPITSTDNYTLNGHSRAGFVQVSSSDYGIYTDMPWISTPDNPALTVMFWGKRDIDGTLGDGWTIRQTIFNGSNIAWGLKMSDNTNSFLELFIQGFTFTLTYPKTPLNQWNHYCFVTNGAYVRYYIDGVMVAEAGANGILGSSGGNNDQNIILFGGEMQKQTIDDLRIFDKALSPSSIADYMNLDITYNTRSGKVKVWDGASWQAHPLKRWDGTTWTEKPAAGSLDGTRQIYGKD